MCRPIFTNYSSPVPATAGRRVAVSLPTPARPYLDLRSSMLRAGTGTAHDAGPSRPPPGYDRPYAAERPRGKRDSSLQEATFDRSCETSAITFTGDPWPASLYAGAIWQVYRRSSERVAPW